MPTHSFDKRLKNTAQETHDRIVQCAAAAFAEQGFRAATMRQIADAAGVNEVTVYRYFPKKQQLYWDAMDWKLRSSGLLEAAKKIVSEANELTSLLCGLSQTLMRSLQQDRTLGRLMYFMALELESEKAKTYEVHLKPLLGLLTAKIELWMAAGTMRRVDPRSAALAISGIMLSQCNLHELLGKVAHSDGSIEQLSNEFAHLIALGSGTSLPVR